MITVTAKLKAKSGKEEEVKKVLDEVIPQVKQEEGTLQYTLHRSKSDPSLFFFFERYRDEEGLKYHSSTPYFKKMIAAFKELLEGPAEIELFEEIAGFNKG